MRSRISGPIISRPMQNLLWGDAGGVFVPTPPPPSLWIDFGAPETITLVGGSTISQIKDRSIRKFDMQQQTAAWQPTYITDQLNGRAVARMAGDWFDNFNVSFSTGEITFFQVVKPSLLNTTPRGVLCLGDPIFAFNLLRFMLSSTGTSVGYRLPEDQSVSLPALALNQWSIIGYTRQANEQKAALNGGAFAYNLNATTSFSSDHVLIGAYTSSNFFYGDMAITLSFPEALTNTEFRIVEGWLAHSLGLAGVLPSDHPYKTESPGIWF